MSRLTSTTLRIGDPAPPFSLLTLDGGRYQLGDALRQGIGLLVFLPGAWSPSTRRQISELERLHPAFLEASISIVVILTQDASSLRRRLLTRPPFPVLIDQERNVVRDYGVYRALSWDGIGVTRPAAFIVDREGAIRFLYVGERDSDIPDAPSLLRLGTWLREGVPAPAPSAAEAPAVLTDGPIGPAASHEDAGTVPASQVRADGEPPVLVGDMAEALATVDGGDGASRSEDEQAVSSADGNRAAAPDTEKTTPAEPACEVDRPTPDDASITPTLGGPTDPNREATGSPTPPGTKLPDREWASAAPSAVAESSTAEHVADAVPPAGRSHAAVEDVPEPSTSVAPSQRAADDPSEHR